ncbi:hypothetical protein V5799_026201 [Amblyomma americanum]|uniref:Uncharacterized protein n=1 Tax=Amblyomma americanum TaxID=6943 RepID=A0AAQ4DJ95_AMBAM
MNEQNPKAKNEVLTEPVIKGCALEKPFVSMWDVISSLQGLLPKCKHDVGTYMHQCRQTFCRLFVQE